MRQGALHSLWHDPGVSFTVLVICTGNICRSPLAERLLRARIATDADIRVESAGTHGLTGRPIDRDSATALRELGVDPDGHEARRLDLRILGPSGDRARV
jgi:protein-tyrosine phosphatase